jgi:hypothetical protein
MPEMISVTLEDVTKEMLYNDWNQGTRNYGWIREES